MINVTKTVQPANPSQKPLVVSGYERVPAKSSSFASYTKTAWVYLIASFLVPVCTVALLMVAWPLTVIFAYGLWLIALICVLITGLLNVVAIICFLMSYFAASDQSQSTLALTTLISVVLFEIALAAFVAVGIASA